MKEDKDTDTSDFKEQLRRKDAAAKDRAIKMSKRNKDFMKEKKEIFMTGVRPGTPQYLFNQQREEHHASKSADVEKDRLFASVEEQEQAIREHLHVIEACEEDKNGNFYLKGPELQSYMVVRDGDGFEDVIRKVAIHFEVHDAVQDPLKFHEELEKQLLQRESDQKKEEGLPERVTFGAAMTMDSNERGLYLSTAKTHLYSFKFGPGVTYHVLCKKFNCTNFEQREEYHMDEYLRLDTPVGIDVDGAPSTGMLSDELYQLMMFGRNHMLQYMKEHGPKMVDATRKGKELDQMDDGKVQYMYTEIRRLQTEAPERVQLTEEQMIRIATTGANVNPYYDHQASQAARRKKKLRQDPMKLKCMPMSDDVMSRLSGWKRKISEAEDSPDVQQHVLHAVQQHVLHALARGLTESVEKLYEKMSEEDLTDFRKTLERIRQLEHATEKLYEQMSEEDLTDFRKILERIKQLEHAVEKRYEKMSEEDLTDLRKILERIKQQQETLLNCTHNKLDQEDKNEMAREILNHSS